MRIEYKFSGKGYSNTHNCNHCSNEICVYREVNDVFYSTISVSSKVAINCQEQGDIEEKLLHELQRDAYRLIEDTFYTPRATNLCANSDYGTLNNIPRHKYKISRGDFVILKVEYEPELPALIGLSGKIGSGKDTLASMIRDIEPKYYITSFANNLKRVVGIITGTSLENNTSRKGKSIIPEGFDETLGRFQQIIGEEMKKIISPDVWIKSVENNRMPYKIISDVRFPDEVDYIKKSGGLVIRIVRDGSLVDDGRARDHISETALDDYDFEYVINNNGTFDDLRNSARKILDNLS